MFNEILVPLDGSSLAEAILPYAVYVASGYNARITLLSVVDPDTPDVGPRHRDYLTQMVTRSETLLRNYLRNVGDRIKGEGQSVRDVILRGKAAESIVSYAEREKCGLIAMSTHGRSGLGRWLSGSVTDGVLRLTETPMLIIRPSETEERREGVKFTKLVAPLDGSPLAESILPYVEDLAKHLGLSVHLVQAIQTVPIFRAEAEYSEYPMDLVKEIEEIAKTYLSAKAQELSRDGIKCEYNVLSGGAAAAITDFAQGTPTALVAMSTHGRSGLGRVLLGSVADRLIRSTANAVLVFHPKEAAS